MRRLLVTGGAGMLGREVAAQALADGWEVRATWHTSRPGLDVEWVRFDLREEGAARAAVRGVDAVVHTAYRQGADEWSTNVEASAAVAAAARDARLVHLSSDVVFDGSRGRYVEDDVPSPVNSYGRSKAEAERRVTAAHPEATLVRTSLIYGGGEGPQERLAREGRTFFVDEFRSPVHVGDLATGILELLERGHTGPLHMGGADDVSRYAFAVLLGADPERIAGAPTTADRAPNVTLDSSLAAALLVTRLRGVYEVLERSSSVRDAR